MDVISFTFEKPQVQAFLDFGDACYHGDTNRIPPFRKTELVMMSSGFDFYHSSGNCHRHFLAYRDDKVVGRISAFINRDLHDRAGKPVATVGFFECIDEYAIAREFLDNAIEWLKLQLPEAVIWGPMNFDIWHGYRFMTQGFDLQAFPGEPYNHPYYPQMFEQYGFSPLQRWLSPAYRGVDMLKQLGAPCWDHYQVLRQRGYAFESLRMDRFGDELKRWHDMMQSAFQGFTGFTPISYPSFEALFMPNKAAFHPDLFVMITDEHRQPAGFATCFLDMGDALRALGGKKRPLVCASILLRSRKIDRVLCYLGGLTPSEAAKKSGCGHAAFAYMMDKIITAGYEQVLFALVAEGNRFWPLLAGAEPFEQRTYTLYSLQGA